MTQPHRRTLALLFSWAVMAGALMALAVLASTVRPQPQAVPVTLLSAPAVPSPRLNSIGPIGPRGIFLPLSDRCPVYFGTGSPDGTVVAVACSWYVERGSGQVYIKTTDATTRVGWRLDERSR